MADAWRHESLTLETLRDVYANLNHAAAGSPAAELTTEHIKSHLQKYRQHHDRSRQPFRDHFERCLRAPAAPAAALPPRRRDALDAAVGRAARRREALDAAVGRAPGVLSELAAARARLRRDLDAALAEHRRLADELAKRAPAPAPGDAEMKLS